MKYNELNITKQRSPKRVGRGISAGQGKTAGRGTKGQGARKSSTPAGFEGGQTRLAMQLPKLRGFRSLRTKADNVYTGQLNGIKSAIINNQVLFENNLVKNPNTIVKLIINGEITAKKNVSLQFASSKAIEMIKKAGGNFEKVPQVSRKALTKKESIK